MPVTAQTIAYNLLFFVRICRYSVSYSSKMGWLTSPVFQARRRSYLDRVSTEPQNSYLDRRLSPYCTYRKTPHVLYSGFSSGLEQGEEKSSKEARQKYPPWRELPI
jgi:hypothetical protein